jgi:diacylglycerol kinase family enzyme
VAPFAGAREVRARSLDGRPVPVQVDGDHFGEATETVFEISAGALRVLA